jgi:hypothetical protein
VDTDPLTAPNVPVVSHPSRAEKGRLITALAKAHWRKPIVGESRTTASRFSATAGSKLLVCGRKYKLAAEYADGKTAGGIRAAVNLPAAVA